MATEAKEENLSLQIKRRFAAPREEVFRAWTDPEALKQWFGPPGYETRVVEVDLRVGGARRIGMRKLPDGEIFFNSGTFREVRPPQRLVFTWRWEPSDMDVGETLVTLEFHERGGETEVVLTHERFPNAKAREEHTEGWNGCLGRLEKYL